MKASRMFLSENALPSAHPAAVSDDGDDAVTMTSSDLIIPASMSRDPSLVVAVSYAVKKVSTYCAGVRLTSDLLNSKLAHRLLLPGECSHEFYSLPASFCFKLEARA